MSVPAVQMTLMLMMLKMMAFRFFVIIKNELFPYEIMVKQTENRSAGNHHVVDKTVKFE